MQRMKHNTLHFLFISDIHCVYYLIIVYVWTLNNTFSAKTLWEDVSGWEITPTSSWFAQTLQVQCFTIGSRKFRKLEEMIPLLIKHMHSTLL